MIQPKSAKHLRNILLCLLLLSAILQGCKSPITEKDSIKKDTTVAKDTICNWLRQPSNYFDTNFHAVFYSKFNACITSNDIYSATNILLSAGKSAIANYQADTLLLNTSIQFINRYRLFIKPVDYSDLLINIGSFYSQAGEYLKANEYFSRIVFDTNNTEIKVIYIASRNEMLYNYLYTGNVDKALDCGFEALKYSIYSKYEIGIAASCAGIAGAYLYNSDAQKALFYLDYAISITENGEDTAGIYMMKSNRVGIYFQIMHPKLLPSIDSLISLYEKWNPENPKFVVDALSWKTIKYIKEGNMTVASHLIDSLKKISSSPKVSEFDYSNFTLAQAEFEKAQNKPISDKSIYLKLLPELWSTRQYHLLLVYYDLLQKDAYRSGDYKNAYQYIIGYNTAKDSLSGLTIKNKIIELENSYESKQLKYGLLEKDHKLSEQKTLIIILIGIIISIMFITASIYFILKIRHLRKEKKANIRFTSDLLEKVEEERMRLASDLHDSVGHDLLYLKNKVCKNNPAIANDVDNIIQTVRGISRDLHPSLFEISGLVLSLEQLISRFQQTTHILINTEFDYKSSLSSKKELQIYRIIQEALSNIIKHSNSIAALVKISETKSAVHVKIADNGIGFDVENKLNSNRSFGLHSMTERSMAINGKIIIKSSPKRTIITIDIPKDENSNHSR